MKNKFTNFLKVTTLCLLMIEIFANGADASQVLQLSENQRVEIQISPDSMNRIAVVNDRISQVFGDEGTFVSQADEQTGQVFIKPSPENGAKPLSITFITENGITQDLTLNPTSKNATTTVFKNTSGKAAQKPMSQIIDPIEKSMPLQEQLLSIMKQLMGGQLEEREEETYLRACPEGYQMEHYKSYQSGPYLAQVFVVQNKTPTPIELMEKTFYQSGDLALVFQKRVLAPNAQTKLYIVRLL